MHVQFVERQNGPERLVCEAEIHFGEGPLAGLKLVGFSLWRGQEGDMFVTFPARSFGLSAERRFFDFLRSVDPQSDAVRSTKDWILEEYRTAGKAAAA